MLRGLEYSVLRGTGEPDKRYRLATAFITEIDLVGKEYILQHVFAVIAVMVDFQNRMPAM